jgi:hypothetical protein
MMGFRVTAPLTLVGAVLASGCGGDGGAIVVTVTGRPATHDVAKLEVTLTHESMSQSQVFDLDGRALPVTFSVTTSGRSGPITIAARGLDAGDREVARGNTISDAGADSADLVLDPSDFVVNTEFAGGQFLNADFETTGFQIAATTSGLVTIGFRDDCPVTACNQFGRRFDANGIAVSTDLGAGTNQFRWNEIDGMGVAHLGMTTALDGATLVFWDTPTGVSCRAMSLQNQASSPEVEISTETSADVVSAVGLADGNVGVTWASIEAPSTRVIRGAVVTPTCTVRTAAFTIAGPVTTIAHRPAIAANAQTSVVAWIDGNEARYRIGTPAGVFLPSGSGQTGGTLIPGDVDVSIDFVRVIASAGGYAVIYRTFESAQPEDRIFLRRMASTGGSIGVDTVVGTLALGFNSPALAARADGAILVVWEDCSDTDGSSCGIIARLVRPSGVPVGDPFVVNTTTRADQTDPSVAAFGDVFVVAYSDSSTDPPDIDETGVRARFLYLPPLDDFRGVIGARCSATPECGEMLTCAADRDGARLCHATCDPNGATPLCPGGGTCTTNAGESACIF